MSRYPNQSRLPDKRHAAIITATIVGGLLFLILLTFGGCAASKSYSRYQKQADARNQVKITHILIQKAAQQAKINNAQIAATIAEARKRVEEAKGIRNAQEIINRTLTPLYIQHEAIQAQRAIASSGKNNTVIYVPAGTNGTPTITANARAGK